MIYFQINKRINPVEVESLELAPAGTSKFSKKLSWQKLAMTNFILLFLILMICMQMYSKHMTLVTNLMSICRLDNQITMYDTVCHFILKHSNY